VTLRRPQLAVVALAVGLGFGSGSPGSADWLVLNDGSRIETKGAWQSKGRLIVFERVGGGLSSLRADAVDLAKSGEATEIAKLPPPPPPPPAAPVVRAPVLVLTDDDVSKAPELSTEGEGGEEAPKESVPLRVTNWDRLDSPNGIEVAGVVRNESSDSVAEKVSVRVVALDDNRAPIGSAAATVAIGELSPGQTSSFRALLAGFKKVGGLRFETVAAKKVVDKPEEEAAQY
jgi:hypothetical protein